MNPTQVCTKLSLQMQWDGIAVSRSARLQPEESEITQPSNPTPSVEEHPTYRLVNLPDLRLDVEAIPLRDGY